MVAMTITMIAYCSLQEDVTPGAVFGDLALQRIFLTAIRAHSRKKTDRREEGNRKQLLRELDRSLKHTSVALISYITSIATQRENIRPNLSGTALARAKQDFVLTTYAGQVYKLPTLQYSVYLQLGKRTWLGGLRERRLHRPRSRS
jgi:hypothetical protein